MILIFQVGMYTSVTVALWHSCAHVTFNSSYPNRHLTVHILINWQVWYPIRTELILLLHRPTTTKHLFGLCSLPLLQETLKELKDCARMIVFGSEPGRTSS